MQDTVINPTQEIIRQVAFEVYDEVNRATKLHGAFPSLHHAYGVIQEEFDEWWELVKINPSKLSKKGRERRLADMREELIQMAAMCVRTVLDMEL